MLLDFGLAEELTPVVRYHFLSFIMMIGAGNGEHAVLICFPFGLYQFDTKGELALFDLWSSDPELVCVEMERSPMNRLNRLAN